MKRFTALFAVVVLAACGGSSSTTGGASGSSSGSSSGATSSGTTSGATSGAATGTTSGNTTATGSSTSGSSGNTGYGAACTVNPTTGVDSCVSTGYLCSAEFTTSSNNGICILPVEFSSCIAAVGCAGDAGMTLECATLEGNNPADGGLLSENVCVEPCTSTANCVDPTTVCEVSGTSGVCLTNLCATGAAPYSTCDAGTEGQCLPYPNGGSTVEICEATGSVANWAACGSGRGQSTGLCGVNGTCVGDPSAPAGSAGLCFPLCDTTATSGDQFCASPGTCQPAGNATFGFCETSCSSSTVTCPSGSTCSSSTMICD